MTLLVFTDGLGNGTFNGAVADVILSGFNVNAADVIAPTLSSPTASATGPTTCAGSITTDEACTGYFVVTESGTAPSVPQIQAGQDNTGAAAAYDNHASPASWTVGANAVSGTGLTAATTYYIHYQGQDAATNDSTVYTSASFTTGSIGTGLNAKSKFGLGLW